MQDTEFLTDSLPMKDRDSIFGATPEGLDRLVSRMLTHVEPEEPVQPTASLETWTERPGGQIGSYKLVSILGEGGMGVVYHALQEAPLKREVALKVIKPGMDTKQVIARFEAERQTLALLDHANIARVYDAGTTLGGRPYFVMELVTGLSITKYCDEHTLSIDERLALFLQVCEAVQHAHQKGIIHRDIKPSNILISRQDARAMPKIIDFGIAKAVTQSLTDRTLYTEQGQFVGTPEYMSPEQADPTSQGVDTRSDIYSLGVVLYELLAGVLPFDADTLRQGGPEHIRRVICEHDPKTPSTRKKKAGLSKNPQSAIKNPRSTKTWIGSPSRPWPKSRIDVMPRPMPWPRIFNGISMMSPSQPVHRAWCTGPRSSCGDTDAGWQPFWVSLSLSVGFSSV